MPDTSKDPIDHARTTRQHAGETVKDGRNAPGLLAVGVGVITLVIGLFGLATAHQLLGVIALALAAVLVIGGLTWVAVAHRKVREEEKRWRQEHPAAPTEPPTS